MSPPQYYWNDTYTNNEGETLAYCLEHYGTKLITAYAQDMRYQVVCLSAERTEDCSWLCWIQHITQNLKSARIRCHEECPNTYKKRGRIRNNMNTEAA